MSFFARAAHAVDAAQASIRKLSVAPLSRATRVSARRYEPIPRAGIALRIPRPVIFLHWGTDSNSDFPAARQTFR